MRIGFLHQPNDIYTPVRMKYFVSRGHEVYSISFPGRNPQARIEGINHIYLPDIFLNRLPFVKRFIYGLNILWITWKYNLDVLHIINALNVFYLICSKASKNVLENEGSDVLVSPAKYPFLKTYYSVFFKYADGIIQDSQLSQIAGMEYYSSSNSTPNQVIEIGVDFKIFNKNVERGVARRKLKIGDNPFVFYSRGCSKIYNVETIIKAIPIVKEKFNDVKFVFTGSKDKLNSELLQFITINNLENQVIFCGFLDHELEIKYFYTDADVVISIPISDSSPFSVYESIACYTPVIVSDLPWIKGKFVPDKNILTVPPMDDRILAEHIYQVLEGRINLDLESAYNVVYEKVNMETENSKLELLYSRLLSAQNG